MVLYNRDAFRDAALTGRPESPLCSPSDRVPNETHVKKIGSGKENGDNGTVDTVAGEGTVADHALETGLGIPLDDDTERRCAAGYRASSHAEADDLLLGFVGFQVYARLTNPPELNRDHVHPVYVLNVQSRVRRWADLSATNLNIAIHTRSRVVSVNRDRFPDGMQEDTINERDMLDVGDANAIAAGAPQRAGIECDAPHNDVGIRHSGEMMVLQHIAGPGT